MVVGFQYVSVGAPCLQPAATGFAFAATVVAVVGNADSGFVFLDYFSETVVVAVAVAAADSFVAVEAVDLAAEHSHCHCTYYCYSDCSILEEP